MHNLKYVIVVLIGFLCMLVVVYAVLITSRRPSSNIVRISPTPTHFIQPTFTPAPTVPIEQSQSKIDEQFYKDYTADEARINPDLTVNNSTPYDNDLFRVETQFVKANPGYFKVLVFLKGEDNQKSRQAVNEWLQSLGISQESIGKLVIEYSLYSIPRAE